MMRFSLGIAVAAAAVFVAGCGEKQAAAAVPTVPMGDAAPAWGSTPELSDWGGFLEGRWSPGLAIDPGLAKEFNLQGMEGETDTSEFWQFSKDGTFYYSEADVSWKINGTWMASGEGVSLSYATFNDKPIAEYHAELKKAAESGRQGDIAQELRFDNLQASLNKHNYLVLDSEQKSLIFSAPGGGTEAMLGGESLERLMIAETE